MLELLFFSFGFMMRLVEIQMQVQEATPQVILRKIRCYQIKARLLLYCYVAIKVIDVVILTFFIRGQRPAMDGVLSEVNAVFNAAVLNTFKVVLCIHMYAMAVRFIKVFFDPEDLQVK